MTPARPPSRQRVAEAAADPRLRAAMDARGRPDPWWRENAACRDQAVDPDLFFPMPTESPDAALAVCGRCPVTVRCLAEALDAPTQEGVAGGATARQRTAMLPTWRGPAEHPGRQKRCPGCSRDLPLEEFYTRPSGGPSAYCRPCAGQRSVASRRGVCPRCGPTSNFARHMRTVHRDRAGAR